MGHTVLHLHSAPLLFYPLFMYSYIFPLLSYTSLPLQDSQDALHRYISSLCSCPFLLCSLLPVPQMHLTSSSSYNDRLCPVAPCQSCLVPRSVCIVPLYIRMKKVLAKAKTVLATRQLSVCCAIYRWGASAPQTEDISQICCSPSSYCHSSLRPA